MATKKHLDRQGTPYEIRYVDDDQAAADAVRLLGYQAVPVVVAGACTGPASGRTS
ncbi:MULTISPECIES: glutaredoxin domain-containing protein [Rhodococcus]|uniref:glutaredoxin domain-containing protein n=1 Tax=Rhodococcus TaxID=1827 RepID=UPI0027E25C68|nr:glutaredoxin domain-containing protein [Rhodococcus pyridinivorans]MDV7253076.1 glutaredoxin domain-containing protein [Rhodococcus pyridinivorans]